MPDINNVIIVGNLIKDPVFRHTTTGTPVTNFYIASNRKFKDNIGNWKEDVCFVGVVAWYKLAESCFENLKKGSAVLVEGELQSRNWKTEDGFNRNVVEIKARRIQFLNKREYAVGDFYNDNLRALPQEPREELMPEEEGLPQEEHALEEPIKEPEPPIEDKPESTNFDFGYKDLKL
jgi:single-strand DNA-binding protein